MYKDFKEECDFRPDLKRRSILFVSLFKNKDTNSALLWTIGVSILYFNLPKVIGCYALLLFPATLALYLLVAYLLLLSFIHFKLNAFHAQKFFKEKTSSKLSDHLSDFTVKFLGSNNSAIESILSSFIKDLVKPFWSAIARSIRVLPGSLLIFRKFKSLVFRKQDGFFKKMASTISNSRSDFWLFVKELVALCSPEDGNGRGFSNIYWNILTALYYKIPSEIAKKACPPVLEFISSIPSRFISFLCALPCLIFELAINALLITAITSLLAILMPICIIFELIFNLLKHSFILAMFILSLPVSLFQSIKRIILFLKNFTVYQVILGFSAVSILLILMTLPLFGIPSYIPKKYIFLMSEFSAIIFMLAIVMLSFRVKTRTAYLNSIAVLFILAVVYGTYFMLLASLVLLFSRSLPVKKTAYLIFFYIFSLIGDYYNIPVGGYFYHCSLIFLLVTDYEEDIEFPSFLFLALHGSYQELNQILRKRINLYAEHIGIIQVAPIPVQGPENVQSGRSA